MCGQTTFHALEKEVFYIKQNEIKLIQAPKLFRYVIRRRGRDDVQGKY